MSKNNNVTLTGNLGGDPKHFQSGDKTFIAFSLATQDRYLDKDENWQNKDTVWHQCLAFNYSLVEAAEKLKKGMRIKVTGSLSYRSFSALLEDDKTIRKQEASIIAETITPVSFHTPSETQPA